MNVSHSHYHERIEHKSFAVIFIIILVITLGILFFIGYFIYGLSKTIDNCAKFNESQDIQTCCNDWADRNNIAMIKCAGEWKIKENKCNFECSSQSSRLPPMPTLDKACGDVPNSQIQSCCDNWAIKNNIVNPACVGNWEIQAGWCIWMCG